MANQDNAGDIRRRSEWFFGRRQSKSLSNAQKERFARLYPKYGLNLSDAPPRDLRGLFPHSADKVILEIGFGGGEHLLHQVRLNPRHGYLGVEPFVNSMAKALKVIDDEEIDNIRLYREDAVELLDWLPPRTLDRVDLLYPDPWPKQRHWKRRFVNQDNLDRIVRVLKPGGSFHFASDIESYVNWTLHQCDRHGGLAWTAREASDWREPFPNWFRTRYETKAVNEGRRPCYLSFERSRNSCCA